MARISSVCRLPAATSWTRSRETQQSSGICAILWMPAERLCSDSRLTMRGGQRWSCLSPGGRNRKWLAWADFWISMLLFPVNGVAARTLFVARTRSHFVGHVRMRARDFFVYNAEDRTFRSGRHPNHPSEPFSTWSSLQFAGWWNGLYFRSWGRHWWCLRGWEAPSRSFQSRMAYCAFRNQEQIYEYLEEPSLRNMCERPANGAVIVAQVLRIFFEEICRKFRCTTNQTVQ